MREVDALRQLYRHTDGNYWNTNDNWLSGRRVESWFGVTRDKASKCVTQLNLADNDLSGNYILSLAAPLHQPLF